ncbi:palmitoyltransferase ZDHHC22 [Latimeria chalumnae]|uniref:Palmitoyltransferase n=1 Tax=Latimeria chalumnae TaxID=7897 RepID=H3AW31_LATCH|nr:PREDICTED: palmitoyltransferase ZDHHC22 [Latimeria chalumnae]|eukprot:XP_005986589.1 PREDICTED: palmitoyltransferase ZDHHC22 [Latimeria chalumnae]
MLPKMFKLRLLNFIASTYFLSASVVTFALQLFVFIPTVFGSPSIRLSPSVLLHWGLFLSLSANVLGNYALIILNPSECLRNAMGPHQAGDSADALPVPGSHFCKLCKKVILRRDHHCFFTGCCIGKKNMRYFIMFCLYTSVSSLYSLVLGVAYITVKYSLSFENPLAFLTLLPLALSYFILGAISGLELFLILLLYVWLGIGLTCAGFCCQQILLVSRGQTWHQVRKGLSMRHGHWGENLQQVFGKRWLLGLFIPMATVEYKQSAKTQEDKRN